MSIFPTKILLATDDSRSAQLAAKTAIDLAHRLDSELHVVYVEPMPERHSRLRPSVDLPLDVVEAIEQEAKTKLEKLVSKIRQAGGEIAKAHARTGLPVAEIVRLGEELGVGLIVMGSRGLGRIRRVLMGSVSDSVARHAHCSVLMVRGVGGEQERGHCNTHKLVHAAREHIEQAFGLGELVPWHQRLTSEEGS